MITFNLHFSYENKKLFHGIKHLEPNKILIKKEMTNCGGKNLKICMTEFTTCMTKANFWYIKITNKAKGKMSTTNRKIGKRV